MATFSVVFYECIMLFGCSFCQWLEPVSIMGSTQFAGPSFHTFGYGIDLYKAGIGEKIEELFVKEIAGPGAVRKTLKENLTD